MTSRKVVIAIVLSMLMLTLNAQDKDSIKSPELIFINEPVPGYPGGYSEMTKFIKNQLKHSLKSKSIQGKVYVSFNVNEDGSLSEISVIRGLGISHDEIAIDIVKKMPKWIPARSENKYIKTRITIPITFN